MPLSSPAKRKPFSSHATTLTGAGLITAPTGTRAAVSASARSAKRSGNAVGSTETEGRCNVQSPDPEFMDPTLICVQVPAELFKKLQADSQKHFILQAKEGWLERSGTTYLCFPVSRAKDAAAFLTAIFSKNAAAILASKQREQKGGGT